MRSRPVGTTDNSPVFQRWVRVIEPDRLSPVGTTLVLTQRRLSSLRDSNIETRPTTLSNVPAGKTALNSEL